MRFTHQNVIFSPLRLPLQVVFFLLQFAFKCNTFPNLIILLLQRVVSTVYVATEMHLETVALQKEMFLL